MSDLQYIVFTVLSQMAVGALIALVIADFLAKDEKEEMFYETASYIILPAVVIAAIAILLSILPNIAISYLIISKPEAWVARETLTMSLFGVWAFVYTILWVLHPKYGSLRGKVGLVDKIVDKLVGDSIKGIRQAVGLISIVVGILFVNTSGMTYALVGLPVLNHFTTPLFFIMTALLVGPATVAAVVSLKYKRAESKQYSETLSAYLGIIWKYLLVVTIVLLALIAVHLQFLQSPAMGPRGRMVVEGMLAGEYAVPFLMHIIIGIAVTLILLVGVMLSLKAENVSRAATLMLGIFASVLIGEIMGRMLFYEFSHLNAYLFEGIPLLGL
ncbi:MAG: dimethyl sulfoxide reductase anchor subunit [Methanocellales archaeon]|nr:dimethyl sulfoxide reductase anchor subunit [Methanocellales archaeon]MDD3291517.1 dimethyl sulfoxide reductase anchor subunit [Methanocellales archaeon]MDD5234593.1 dimethyl sulfoxide reductase anchor subunit [Methanocellales archaeon]MDD5485054.1 dimethyl sulfoxide reductase anchor subunit [Methanocellales archaeon]